MLFMILERIYKEVPWLKIIGTACTLLAICAYTAAYNVRNISALLTWHQINTLFLAHFLEKMKMSFSAVQHIDSLDSLHLWLKLFFYACYHPSSFLILVIQSSYAMTSLSLSLSITPRLYLSRFFCYYTKIFSLSVIIPRKTF